MAINKNVNEKNKQSVIDELTRRQQNGTLGANDAKRLADLTGQQVQPNKGGVGQNQNINTPVPNSVTNGKYNTPGGALTAGFGAADAAAGAQDRYNRMNQYTPFGSQTYSYDENGREVVNQNLDPSQQGILNADNQLSQTGRNLANSNLQGGNFGQSYTPQTMQRDYTGAVADRSRIEDEVFKKLTKGVEDQQKKETANLEQTLADRGIPIGSKAYANAMKSLTDRYDNIYADAHSQAVSQGGQELATQVGIQNQTIADQFSQGWQNRQNQFGEVSGLSNLGAGLRTPNFYQPGQVNYDPYGGAQIGQGYYNINQQKASNDAQLRLAASKLGRGSGGGGGSSGPQPPPLYNNQLPPGAQGVY